MQKFYFLIILLLAVSGLQAQDFRFGKVSKEEVAEKVHPKDSEANAAVLFRKQATSYEVDPNTGLTVVTEVHERIKIYNKEGFDWATKEISFYHNNATSEKISGLKGYTYNLENGKLKDEKLSNSSIFDENSTKYYNLKKFTMPLVTEGSVIEYTYTLRSPFFTSIDDFPLQYTIPINHLEASLKVPEFLVFKAHFNPRSPLIFPVKEDKGSFLFTTSESIRGGDRTVSRRVETSNHNYIQQIYSLVTDNIPALKSEAHIDNLSNYAAFWKWELLITKFPESPVKNYSETWEGVAKSIFTDGGYENELKQSNYFVKDLNPVIAGIANPLEKAEKIYEFAKSRVKWNNYSGLEADLGTVKAYNAREGNVADINLMLTSMLNFAGLKASPVLLSTKNNGIPLFPTRKGFNYVVCGLEHQGKLILLDATEENASFGELPERARNWNGRIMRDRENSDWVSLMPTGQAGNISTVNYQIDENFMLKGKSVSMLNGLYAKSYRDKYKNVNSESYIEILEKGKGNIEISNLETENSLLIGEDIKQSYDFELKNGLEVISDKMYIKPLIFMALAENPFKAQKRQYPIIFDFPLIEKKTANIIIPEGFEIDYLPESSILELNNGGGSFKFLVLQNGNFLRIESVLDLKHTVYTPEDYNALKEFYAQIVEKNTEAIVLKRT